MGDFVFNIAKGRVAELAERVAQNDPANSALIAVAINTTATDATLQDLDDLAAVIANINTVEAANTGYARIVLTDADLSAISPDDTNDRMDIDIPDLAFGAITNDDVNWTDILICYDGDTTGGTDANIIPLTQHDAVVTIDGSSVTIQINTAGFYRAS